MPATLTVRMDKEMKIQAEKVIGQMGLDLPTATRIFLQQTINRKAIPFEIRTYSKKMEDEIEEAIFEGRRLSKNPNRKTYSNFNEILKEEGLA